MNNNVHAQRQFTWLQTSVMFLEQESEFAECHFNVQRDQHHRQHWAPFTMSVTTGQLILLMERKVLKLASVHTYTIKT